LFSDTLRLLRVSMQPSMGCQNEAYNNAGTTFSEQLNWFAQAYTARSKFTANSLLY